MDKIAVRIETEEQFNIFKKWNTSRFEPWRHYSRYDSNYQGVVCFQLKQGTVDFCYESYYKKIGWGVIPFEEFERDYLGKKVEGKVTNPINGTIYRALYEPSNYTYIFRYGTTDTFIRVPVKDFGLNGTKGNLALKSLVLFNPTTEEIDWFVACELAGKYVDPPSNINEGLRYNIGEIVNTNNKGTQFVTPQSTPGIGSTTHSNKKILDRKDIGIKWYKLESLSNWFSEDALEPIKQTIQEKERVPNSYGMKVGDKLPAGILNAYTITDKNCYYGNRMEWATNGMFHGDRTIESITIIDDYDVYLVSGTDKVYIKAKGFKEFLENKTPKDTSMNNEELLKEAARRCPIGTEYIDLGPNKLPKCKAVKSPTTVVIGSEIEVGMGYVYYHGKWAEVISTPTPEVKREEFKEGDWVVVLPSDNFYGNAEKDQAQELTQVNKLSNDFPYHLKFKNGMINQYKQIRMATQAEIDKAIGKQVNSKFKVGDFVHARGLNTPEGMEIAKIEGDNFWLYDDEAYKRRGEYKLLHYQFSKWPSLAIVQKKGKISLQEAMKAEEKPSWSEYQAEYLNMRTSIKPRFDWKEYTYNTKTGEYKSAIDPEKRNKLVHQKPLVMKRRDNKPKLITISK